jgi:hypothetical protein
VDRVVLTAFNLVTSGKASATREHWRKRMNDSFNIIGLDRIRAKATMIEAASCGADCQKTCSDGECASWKTPINQEERVLCQKNDPQTRINIALRSFNMKHFLKRHVDSCVFSGEAVVGALETDTPEIKEKAIHRFICVKKNTIVCRNDCYMCGHFKEKENVSS